MLETLTIQDWENYLETYFQVDTGNQVQITLKLISVTGYGQSFGGKPRSPFHLCFSGLTNQYFRNASTGLITRKWEGWNFS